MIHKKIVGIVAAILATTVTIITTTTFATGDEVDDMVAKYNKTTQRFNRTEVSTIISEVEEMDNGGNSGGSSGGNNCGGSGGNNGGGSGGGGGTNPPPTPPPPPGPTGPRSPVNQTFYDFDCAMGTYKDYGNGFTGTSQGHACWDSLKGFAGTKSFRGGGCGFAATSFACSKVSGKAWTAGDVITTLGGDLTIDTATDKYKWEQGGKTLDSWNFQQSYLVDCLKAANPKAKVTTLTTLQLTAKPGRNSFYFVYVVNDPIVDIANNKRRFSSSGMHWFIIDNVGRVIYGSGNVKTFDFNSAEHKANLKYVWEVTW